MNTFWKRLDIRVTAAYGFFATLWILLSDNLLELLTGNNHALHAAISVYKGLGFVAFTAGGLFLVMNREFRKRNRIEAALQQAQITLEQKVSSRTAELQAAKDQLESILDNSQHGILLVRYDLSIQRANTAFDQLLDCEPNTYLNHTLLDFIHPDDISFVKKQLCRAPHEYTHPDEGSQAEDHFEVRILRQSGKIFDAELHIGWIKHQPTPYSKVDSFVCSIQDITERKAYERQLLYDASLQESLSDAVIVTDLDFRIQSWNRAAERIYGWSADEARGKVTFELNRTEFTHKQAIEEAVRLLFKQDYWQGEVSEYRKDDTKLYILASVNVLRDKSGKAVGIIGTSIDLTQRNLAEQALRASEQKLREALEKEKELNELKSRFVSMASHEFRNPLAAILASTETLTAYREQMTPEQIGRRLTKIQEQVGYLKEIMDDVLLLARLQARRAEFNPQIIDVTDVLRGVLEEFQGRPDITHRLQYLCEVPPPPLKLDRKLIRQMTSNLIANAIKYSPADKPVIVRLDYQDETLILKVQDEGIGIPEADQKRLFEPFHRAANVGSIHGTGLGLVIAKESVDLHGGTISVESQVGVGTCFTVRIPNGKPSVSV